MQAYIDAGNGFVRCRLRFGIAHATWKKAIAHGDLRVATDNKAHTDARKRYDWAAVQAYYDEGHTVRACRKRFGFSDDAWAKAVRRRAIQSRGPREWTIDELAPKRSNRKNIKRRLLEAGVLLHACALCGIREWQGAPLTLQIDHINGRRLDYRLENLRMLCPNCHSQTVTFAGRNIVVRRRNPG